MSAVAAVDVSTLAPLTRSDRATLAATEYERVITQWRSLSAADWSRPTDCELWDVRTMAGHTVGMASDFTSLPKMLRRMASSTVRSKRSGAEMIDVMTAAQAADHAAKSVDELIAAAEAIMPRAARWRTTRPGFFRSQKMKQEIDGTVETWTLEYLFETILTRDPWMHRMDTAKATGRAPELTADHDGRFIADVVTEWARRHGQPFTLTLTGPAGGTFTAGSGGEAITIDAIDFCRTLSGRMPGEGLLATQVPF
jgi:uncharacterized protein (TIGR03083 family)